MKILFVCHRLPFPPSRGGKIRPFNMIRHLSQNHSVVVATLAESELELQEGSNLKNYCAEVITEIHPPSARRMQACRALFTRTPSSVSYFSSSRLHRRIRKLLVETRFDVILVHCAFVAQYVADCADGFQILDYGDLDSSKWFDYSRHRSLPLSLGYSLEARKLRRYEKEMARRFSYCTFTTPSEMAEFKTLGIPVPCKVIPNGVDTKYFRQTPQLQHNSSVVVFLGRMDYFPNVDGIVYFATKVLPIIRRILPTVELRIIGSSPTRMVRRLTRIPGVSITGHVPDVRSYLSDAAVMIAPLRIARGTQNKVLESMAMGIPVVATSHAARGIQAVPGQHLLVADGPVAFANNVIEVMQNPTLWQNLSEAGRRQVEHMHAWPHSMQLLDNVVNQSNECTVPVLEPQA